ncbi:hypothetical protein [Streptomyces cacaoi]|uniref:Uncharacterized protein n=1 Tax=Streptomyces cacaoi TaxID=1898 RepID=A0A4Y3QYE9_STRCI|nr:hypothetical protein [Streptomyces cacaoi]GEB50445.1 hypothetical protein SCA03_29960 [Streptomyces cacaoi]
MTPVLPDAEGIVLEALRAYLPELGGRPVTHVIAMPNDWGRLFPLVMARKSAGSAVDPRYLDSSVFTVHAFASDRREASLLARSVRQALYTAAQAQFAATEYGGYLSHFREVTGPMYSAGDTNLNHPDIYRFVASYLLNTRPS